MALLEYLYTDHAPIEEGDSVEIMILADRFCLPRLVTLCELYITKRVDKVIQKRVADGTSDVVNLLLTSQVTYLCSRYVHLQMIHIDCITSYMLVMNECNTWSK